MMPIARFELPDGRIARFEVPEGTTPEQAQFLVQSEIAQSKPDTFLGMDKSKLSAVGQGAKDAAGGFARSGMGVVSNLMRPFEAAIPGGNDFDSGNQQRMARVDQRYRNEYGVNPDAVAFQGGKLAGDVVATLPVGGALAAGAKRVPMLTKSVPGIENALRTGGMTTGNNLANATRTARALDIGTRVAGGGITGGAMAGIVDPESVGTGAMVGAALPPGLKVAGQAGKLVKRGAGTVASNLLGATTGTGAESIRAAYGAGKTGSTKFLDNMRGNVSFDDVVGEAKSALGKMREARAADYRSGMVDISNDKTVLDFQPIDSAMRKIAQLGSYKGQQINKNAAGTVDDLMATVDNWRGLDPAEYHTPEGLDALKQAIGDIRDSTQFGTAARRAADEVYNSVKNQITAQAPTYSKVMKDYSEASALLKEIESGLSLGPKASKDTAVRKLQSLLRNNAQTNYGNRLNLASKLEQKGGADLMPSLAGQSMTSAMPRGMVGALQKGGALLSAASSGGATVPLLMAAAPFSSPRLMGEALYGLGRANAGAGYLGGMAKNSLINAAQRSPGLLDLEEAIYRSIPLVASQANP